MKVRTALLTAVVAVAMVGQAADWNLGLAPGTSWGGWVNAFELDGTTFATGFGEDPLTGKGSFDGVNKVTLAPNTRLYDENFADDYWVSSADFSALKIVEFNYYQEYEAAIGDTVEFNWTGLSSDLPAGYEVLGFIKVLDAFASWATTQYEFAPVVPGVSQSLSFTVADAGDGGEFIQAGFAIKGLPVSGGAVLPIDPAALTSIEIIPEPATIGLLGIAGLGMFVARRRLKI
jgi:hypothetical protein